MDIDGYSKQIWQIGTNKKSSKYIDMCIKDVSQAAA